MRRRRSDVWVSSARSRYVNFGPSFLTDHLECLMFLEDVRNQVVPYRLDRSTTIKVSTKPASRRARELVADALDPESWQTDQAAEHFLRACCSALLRHVEVPYEIDRLRRPRAKRPARIVLRQIQPWTVKPASGGLVQQIPEGDRRISALLGDEVAASVFLPDDDIVRFRLPGDLRNDVETAMDDLVRIPAASFPDWHLDDLALEAQGKAVLTPIDVTELKRRRLAGIAAATGNIGWDARRSLQGEVNKYYLLVRQIRWQRFLCRLREAVLQTLNEALPRVLAPLGVAATVCTQGLPSLSDLESLEAALAQGEISLGEGYSRISVWRFGADVHSKSDVIGNPEAAGRPDSDE